MDKPDIIKAQEAKLRAICEADNRPDIKVKIVAEYLGMDEGTLQQGLLSGDIKFGVAVNKRHIPGRNRNYFNISKLALWNHEMGNRA